MDTVTAVYNYSPTAAGILFNKSPNAGQTNFSTVVNTLYMGNGIDLYKLVGPNLLTQSNTFSASVWTTSNVTSLTGAQFDPIGGLTATQVVWASTSGYILQNITPNYTPVASNTFTASIWIRANSGAPTVTLFVQDQAGANITSSVVTLNQTWTKYSITGILGADSTQAVFKFGAPSNSAINVQIYGAQLEIGGPATPTQITISQPQGIYLWGIVAPTVAPTVISTALGAYWQAGHTYNTNDSITDANGNRQTVTAGGGGASGGSAPAWATTAAATTIDGALTWTNSGPNGLSPKSGYQWYYAFLNQYTGHPSNVSPISLSTSTLANNLGVAYTLKGNGSTDPQANQIAIYRNIDGGAFFFQVGVISNPVGGGTWSYVDTTQDASLSTIYAPIGLLNSPPPQGAANPVWYQSRMWVSVGANLYYSSSTDNAVLLNIQQNGVVAESFALANLIPLDQLIVHSIPTSSGLLVATIGDSWLITGSDLASFNPVKALLGHGIRNYNAIDSDGSSIWLYTSDRQFLSLNASAGSIEVGYAIGDTLTSNLDPTKAYVVRHVGGSTDNAVFLADGSTGWYRMNPNQVGASVSGEPTSVWSPFATIVGGVQAIGSIETSPGVHQFLLGSPGTSSILTFGQLAGAGANAASGVSWTNPNNLTLNNPATPATVTLNVQATPSGADVFGGASGTGTAVSTGNVTTASNNELGIVAIEGGFTNATQGLSTTITAGGSWTVDYQASEELYRTFPGGISYYFCFGSEKQSLAAAGVIAGTATLSRSQDWSASIATFVSGTGAAPTVVQQAHNFGENLPGLLSLSATFAASITSGNFLVVTAACDKFSNIGTSLSVTDSLGNVFTAIVTSGQTAIFLAPIISNHPDVVTLHCAGGAVGLALNVYEITLPSSTGSLTSKQLQATVFGLNVPNNNITGVKVYVIGSQSSSAPDATVTVSWINPIGASPTYTFQLPITSGTMSFGGSSSTWGQALTAALLNNSVFGFQLQATAPITPNVTFNISGVLVSVSYLGGAVVVFPVLFRDLTSFTDNGFFYTWDATLGSLVLAFSGTMAEVESVSTFVRAASANQPGVGVLLDEISGAFETLPNSVNDPPQLAASSSVLAKRFYLSQGATPPLCQHMQIKLSGGAFATKDEILALVVRGAIVPEQEA